MRSGSPLRTSDIARSLDHLFVEQEAVPTLVEDRDTDRRLRIEPRTGGL